MHTAGNTLISVYRGQVSGRQLANELSRECSGFSTALIIDTNFYSLWQTFCCDVNRYISNNTCMLLAPATESSKSLTEYGRICETLLNSHMSKHLCIIGVGGGVINNVAGFVASTLYRGVALVQIPTTFLAQVDAAIDVKHALNLGTRKNAIGSIYAPNRVMVLPQFIATLPPTAVADGMAEVIKHALCQGGPLFNKIFASKRLECLAALTTILGEIIPKKVALVQEREEGSTHADFVLQYGHSFAHAIEGASEHRISHGSAVAIGMMLSAQIGARRGLAEAELLQQHAVLLDRYHLPLSLPMDLDPNRILQLMRGDRYYIDGGVRMGILTRVGMLASPERSAPSVWVSMDEIASLLTSERIAAG